MMSFPLQLFLSLQHLGLDLLLICLALEFIQLFLRLNELYFILFNESLLFVLKMLLKLGI
jgi:hypothetical protein